MPDERSQITDSTTATGETPARRPLGDLPRASSSLGGWRLIALVNALFFAGVSVRWIEYLRGSVPDEKILLARVGCGAMALAAAAVVVGYPRLQATLRALGDAIAHRFPDEAEYRPEARRVENILAAVFVAALSWLALHLLLSPHFVFFAFLIEDGPIESITALLYLAAAGMQIRWALLARSRRGTALFLGAMGALFFVIGMEEMSWGQRLIGYEVPTAIRELNVQGEITLHNLWSNTLNQLAAILVASTLLYFLPLASFLSPRLRRAVEGLGIPIVRIRYAAMFALGYASYLFVGWNIGTFGIGRYRFDPTVPRHADDELLEFVICMLFFALAASGWRLRFEQVQRRTIALSTAPLLASAGVAALAITVADCVLLQRKYGIFTGSFLRTAGLDGWQLLAFLSGSLVLDMAFAFPLVVMALFACRRLRWMTRWQQAFTAAMIGVLPIALFTLIRFEVARFFGDQVQFTTLRHLASGSIVEMLLQASSHLLGGALLVGGFATAVVIGNWILRRLPLLRSTEVAAPTANAINLRRLATYGSVLLLAAPMTTALATVADSHLFWSLQSKTTGGWASGLASWLTDFDRDGYGLVNAPRDFAPLRHDLHPFAVDWPGNGIDENGVGGDLPRSALLPGVQPATLFARRPDVVVIVLESFRRDNLTAVVNGNPVTPRLRALVNEGANELWAYAHSSYTTDSRSHLLTGTLHGRAATTLVDDFRDNGYATVVVSGADESFADMDIDGGMRRADIFVDSRNDMDERTSPFTTAGSLHVPWPVVVRNAANVVAALEDAGDDRPLFLFINLIDCHFPYSSHATEHLLELPQGEPISRSRIGPDNAEWLQATYRNSAANVDRAVGQIIDNLREQRGEPAFVIVGDHGEGLFDTAPGSSSPVLGHGTQLTLQQQQVPLIIGGLALRAELPLGMSEVRGLLVDALSRPGGKAETGAKSISINTNKWVPLYVGDVDRPASLGAGWDSGIFRLNMATGEQTTVGVVPTASPAMTLKLVHTWESVLLQRTSPVPDPQLVMLPAAAPGVRSPTGQ